MKRTEEHYNEYITIIIEKSTGRSDIILKVFDGNAYYYAEKHGNKWELKFCENGFCYDTTLVDTCKTLKGCIDIIYDVCESLTEYYRTEEDKLAHYRTYKGYTITGNENTGIVALDPHGHYSSKVYKTEEEAIADIEKDIVVSVPIEETEPEEADSFVVPVEDDDPVEVIEKAHEILSNLLTELEVRNSVMKSAFNSYYGKQVIDAELPIVKTELHGFHVNGVITETGMLMIACDIYAQDLDIKESYLAYNDGNGYAVYNEISLTRIAIYPNAEALRQFFAIRVNALEAETLKKLY